MAKPENFGTWRAALRAARVWLFSRPATAPAKMRRYSRNAQLEPSARPVLARLSLREQWDRLTHVLVQSTNQVSQARELQGRALQQIDLATYAFNNIVDELAAVMALPARREPAVVHLFEPVLVRNKERVAASAYRAA